MQKHIWMIFCFILLVLLICLAFYGCTNYPGFINTQYTAQTEKSILVYKLDYEQYFEFLEEPSVHYLESNTTKYEYSIDKQNNKKIIQKKFDGTDSVKNVDDGGIRISHTPVHVSLIDFWSDISQVQQYLQSNNISADIEDVVFLSCYELPCSVGVYVESEWYFVTIDEYSEDYQQNIHSDSYVYRIYTRNEFIKKYGKSDADLLINGVKSLSVKMYYDHAEIPILNLFKLLGADIQWNNNSVTIIYNGKNAKIYTETRIIELGDRMLCGEESPGGVSCFVVQGTEIYLDTTMAADVLRVFGIEMSWSREENNVCVNTN